ncbi:MAG: EamA family transporter [Candidatus Marinimicrobia bacterium]|nr:EamA family transporter [Candidatus Neomarinimicrobiota bacterium]
MTPPSPQPSHQTKVPASAIVLFGSLLASTSVLWIRSLPPMSPLMVGFVRAAGAALVLMPWFIAHVRRDKPALRDFRYSALAGVALGLHFGAWIASLAYTTVAQSVLLVTIHPLFIIVISVFLLRRSVARNQVLGAVIATAGIVIIQLLAGGEAMAAFPGARPALGNLLALSGGFFAAIYFLLGQAARRSLRTVPHVVVAFAFAAVTLYLLAMLSGDTDLPTSGRAWMFLALLVLLPTVGGHTLFNWGIRHIGAPMVSLMGLLEPVGAAGLALLFLGEPLGWATLLGGAVILAGLGMALGGGRGRGSSS